MMQGDAYSIEIRILSGDGTDVTAEDVRDVEITIGPLRKTYRDGDVRFDGVWKFPVTQEETFGLLPARARAQVRVEWPSGDVEGVSLGEISVRESISKEVLA